jgi:DNA-binding transcriptional LysR family regulator
MRGVAERVADPVASDGGVATRAKSSPSSPVALYARGRRMKTDTTPRADASPDLGDLRAFCLVVDLGSITAAAKALGEAKGSVSRRLTRLEETLGVTLLKRTPRLVQATDVGASYRARLGRALELLDDATEQAREAHDTPAGRLRVTAPIDLGQSLLAPLVAEFGERHPDVTVEMVLSAAVLDFDAHQIDVAVRAGGALRDSSLIAHKLDALEGRLFASPAYLARRGTPEAPSALSAHRLVLTRVSGVDPLLTLRRGDDEPEEVAVRPSVVALDYSFAKEVALADGGVAVLPTIIVRREVEAGRLSPVLPEHSAFRGTLYLLHQGSRFVPPKVRAFRDFVTGACRSKERAKPAR